MKAKWLVVAVAVVVLAAGCSRREQQSVTGSYGSGLISGEVVMEEGGSPAGVEMSIRGTGLFRTLGADGKFVFAAVPDRPEFVFHRDDGIAASLQLEESTGHVVIALARTSARKTTGRRRAVGGGGVQIDQFEGLVRSVTSEQLVVFTSKKEEVTIGLTASTVIRKGNRVLTVADLVVDAQVHVTAQRVEGGHTAIQVKLQRLPGEDDDGDDDGDDDAAAVREYEGTVVSASASQLVVFDSHRAEVTFVLDAATVIGKGNTPVLPAEIQPGWRVHVKATTAADGTNTAIRVTIQNTRTEVKINGTVMAVGAADLTVQAGSTTYAVATDAATRIRRKGVTIALSDIVVGDRVAVDGTSTGPASLLASEIDVKSK